MSVSQTYTEKADCTEEWYGVKYCVEKHAAEKETVWRDCGYLWEFHLPDENGYIPRNFDLVVRDPLQTQYPRLIRVC